MQCPVIIVLDNDNGLKQFAGQSSKSLVDISITVDTTDDFYHIRDNLYVIKTPETGGESCIEDMFPDEWLDKQYKGKKFKYKSETKGKKFKLKMDTEYGKEDFAQKVVVPNANKIDFSRFDSLLERIVKVLDHYKPPS